MEIKIEIGKKKIGILEKITLILFGVFITSLIFAFLIQNFEKAGIWIGLVLSALIVFSGFYYIEKGTRLRIIAWGILGTIIGFIILFTIAVNFLSNSLEGF